MKIQVNMPDSRGTFTGQSIEAEENAQVLFASFLPVAGLVENQKTLDKTPDISIDFMNDGMDRIVVNTSSELEHDSLLNDDFSNHINVAKLSDTNLSSEVLNNTSRINEASHKPMTEVDAAVFSKTGLVPNILEQINTVSAGAELKSDSPAGLMIANMAILKESDLMKDEADVLDKQIHVEQLEAKTGVADRIPLEQAPMSVANKKVQFPEVFSTPDNSDKEDHEASAIDSNLVHVNELASVKTLANPAEQSPLPGNHSFDTLLTNVADFLNKKLDPAALPMQNKAGDAIALNTAVYRELDNNPGLKAFQYNSTELPASLKVDSYFATLKVYPPDLGQVTAEIQINKGMTELTLRADNPQIRHFIETSLPQLRESFENFHINLGEVNIQNSSSDNSQDFQKNHYSSSNMNIQQKPDDARTNTETKKPQSNLIIDTWA